MNRVLAGIVAGVATVLAFASTAWGDPPRAALARFDCVQALAPANRAISIQAVMRPLSGTAHLELKFDLLEATGTGPSGGRSVWGAVHGGDLGTWISPADPTLGQVPGDVWRLNKSVLNLDAPARYRYRVYFRWVDANGRTLGTAVRTSPACHEPELRPDLLVRSLTVAPDPTRPGVDRYTAVIANEGATAAGQFEVLFTPSDGEPAIIRPVPSLGAHRTRQMVFTSGVCNAADPPTLTVDAADQIDDYNRANNEMTAVCPPPS